MYSLGFDSPPHTPTLPPPYPCCYAHVTCNRNDADAASLETVLRVAAGADFADALDYMMWEALKKHGKDGALGDLETGIDEDRFDTFLDRCPLAEALLDELFIPIDGIAGNDVVFCRIQELPRSSICFTNLTSPDPT